MTYTVKSAGTLELKLDDEIFVVKAERWNPVVEAPQQKIYKSLPYPILKDGDVVRIKGVDEEACALFCETRQCNERLKEIKTHIQNMPTPEVLVAPPQEDQLVLSPCEGEEGLFRGVVKSVKNQLAEINFVDYGNVDLVPVKNLRNVDEKLANLEPALAQSPIFSYLKEKKCSANGFNYFEENVTKKYVVNFLRERN